MLIMEIRKLIALSKANLNCRWKMGLTVKVAIMPAAFYKGKGSTCMFENSTATRASNCATGSDINRHNQPKASGELLNKD